MENELASLLSQWEGEIGLIDVDCPRWGRREWQPTPLYTVCICIIWLPVSRLWVIGLTDVEGVGGDLETVEGMTFWWSALV